MFSPRPLYILGYIPRDNRVYLGDKELNVISYSIQLSVLEYQTAIMRKDFDSADKVELLAWPWFFSDFELSLSACMFFHYLGCCVCVQVLPTVPIDQRTRVAHFLEKQGFKQQALAVSTDLDHK